MFREFSSDSAVGYVILTADLFVFLCMQDNLKVVDEFQWDFYGQ